MYKRQAIGLLTLNRTPNSKGVAHGGVIAYRAAMMNMRRLDLPNPDAFEVLIGIGTLQGHARRVATVAAYVPPGYTVARGRACLKYIADCILEIKRRYREPTIMIAGDFNQWEIDSYLEDFIDISEVPVGPTRSASSIDRMFTNKGERLKSKGTAPPLDARDSATGVDSNHRVAYARLDLKKQRHMSGLPIRIATIMKNQRKTSATGSSLTTGRKLLRPWGVTVKPRLTRR